MTAAKLGPAQQGSQAHIRSMLLDANLPVEDLDTASVDFIVATDGDQTLGCIGLEQHGSDGLLRSLVVLPKARGNHLGDQLVRSLEAYARSHGLNMLVLLTTTAASFFAARGYRVVDQKEVPYAIQRSTEFRSLCPASATCMIKPLGNTP